MHRPAFRRLRSRLLESGIAPSRVNRMILELRDHYEDLVEARLEAGFDRSAAVRAARRALGCEAGIAGAALEHRELLSWPARHPLIAECARSAAMVAVLPAVPFVYCAHRGPVLARWGVSLSLAVVVTGGLLLTLNAILFVP